MVLGEEARDNGLKVSLLERLLKRYGTSPVALPLCAKLRTNYRCHRGILNLCSKLFYDSSLKCHVPNDIAHRSCPFPLMFFCTSENEFAVGTISPPDKELEAVVDQAVQCIQHWPDSWGPKDLSEVSIITPSRSHVSLVTALPDSVVGTSQSLCVCLYVSLTQPVLQHSLLAEVSL